MALSGAGGEFFSPSHTAGSAARLPHSSCSECLSLSWWNIFYTSQHLDLLKSSTYRKPQDIKKKSTWIKTVKMYNVRAALIFFKELTCGK